MSFTRRGLLICMALHSRPRFGTYKCSLLELQSSDFFFTCGTSGTSGWLAIQGNRTRTRLVRAHFQPCFRFVVSTPHTGQLVTQNQTPLTLTDCSHKSATLV
jgi:hypothetical protein